MGTHETAVKPIETVASYVTQTPEGSWRVAGTRVLLESIIHAFRHGQTPEAIALEYPTLTVEQVYGAIAFYLRNREQMDEYVRQVEARFEQLKADSEARHGELLNRIRSRRKSRA